MKKIDTITGLLFEPRVRVARPTLAMLDGVARRVADFNDTHGAQHKAQLLELVKELSDLRPPKLVEKLGSHSDFRVGVEMLEKDQEHLQAASLKDQIASKPAFTDDAIALGNHLKNAAKDAAFMANARELAQAYMRDGKDNPRLVPFSEVHDFAIAAQQRQLWAQLATRLRPLQDTPVDKDFRREAHLAVGAYYGMGGDMQVRHIHYHAKLKALMDQPNEHTLRMALEMLDTKINLFDGKYGPLLIKCYRSDAKAMDGTQPKPDPRDGHSDVLDIVYLARWSAAAELLGERMYTNRLSIADPKLFRANAAVPEVKDVQARGMIFGPKEIEI